MISHLHEFLHARLRHAQPVLALPMGPFAPLKTGSVPVFAPMQLALHGASQGQNQPQRHECGGHGQVPHRTSGRAEQRQRGESRRGLFFAFVDHPGPCHGSRKN